MLRFLVILAIGFAASQFPAFYWAYTSQVDRDLTVAQQSAAPPHVVAELKNQRTELIQADVFQRPLTFIESWDSDRVFAVLGSWEPFVPDNGDDLAHGAVGLFIGYILTGLLFAPFRSRPAAPRTPRPAASRVSKPKASKARSTIPVSTGNLRELKNRAKATIREAAETARRQTPWTNTDETSDGTATDAGDLPQPVSPGLRGNDAIIFARPRPYGAITMSYYRPPLITRRHTSQHIGPIERVTLFRD